MNVHRDQRSGWHAYWWIGVIKSHLSDRRWNVRVRPRQALWWDASFDSSVRSIQWSRWIRGPSGASNLDRYKSGDGRLGLKSAKASLKSDLRHVLWLMIRWTPRPRDLSAIIQALWSNTSYSATSPGFQNKDGT